MRRQLLSFMSVPALVAAAFGFSQFANAAAQRTFVSVSGADNPACSLAAPCRAFAAAITAVAAGGEIIALDSGGYGAITVTKSVSIDAPQGIYAGVSVFSGDGVTIDGTNIVVVLRGLTINGQGGLRGIFINNAGVVHVENCVIANMPTSGITQFAGTLELKDVTVRNGGYGVVVQGPGQANLDHVRIEANTIGLAAFSGGHVAMQNSIVTGSSTWGIVASLPNISGSEVTISRSMISSNNYGIYVDADNGANEAIVTVSESTISDNAVGIHVTSNGDVQLPGHTNLKHNTITANDTGLEVVSGGVAFIDDNYMVDDKNWDLSSDSTSVLETRGNNSLGSGTFPSGTHPIGGF